MPASRMAALAVATGAAALAGADAQPGAGDPATPALRHAGGCPAGRVPALHLLGLEGKGCPWRLRAPWVTNRAHLSFCAALVAKGLARIAVQD
jgi:hypothetical protein